jgi:hypothetical protein
MTLNERLTFRNASLGATRVGYARRRDRDRSPGYIERAATARVGLKRRAKRLEPKIEIAEPSPMTEPTP